MKKIILLLSLVLLFNSCQEDDTIVQSLFDLSGAPLKYDDSKATKFLHVAAVGITVSQNKEVNVSKIEAISQQVKMIYPEVELLLFGESILGWYIDDDKPEVYQREIAETIPGASTNTISEMAKALNVHVVFGMTETREDKIYNAQVLINNEGAIEAVHRKVKLTPEDIRNGITPATKTTESVTVAMINGIKAGMIICADVNGYWLTKQLVDQKVELILHSMASSVSEFAIDPVSRQFNAWEVFANRYGNELENYYSGTTYIADPSGTIRASGSGGEIYKVYKIGVR